jgi:chaperonin GroEL
MINQEFINDIKIGTNIIDGAEYKDTLEAVAQITCDIVTKTLGPYASTTVIDDGASTYSTKDGWSVVNRIRFSDAIENILFGFIKDISFSLNSKVGDGTTTAIVAANTFIKKFRSWIENARKDTNSDFHNLRQADLLKAIEETAEAIIEELKSDKRVKHIEKPEDIYKISYISTNGNEQISKMISDIYKETSNPNIHVTLNTGGETRYEIENGYKIDAKLLDPNCHYNTSEETCELNDECKIVIFDHNVTYTKHYKLVQSLIKSICNQQEKPQMLVIMAPYYDEIFTSVMSATIRKIVNNGQISPIILVQIPYSTTTQKCYINDFAILCETQIFNASKLEMYTQMNKALSGEVEEDEQAQEVYKSLMEANEFNTPEDILDCSIGKARKLTIGKNFVLLEKFRKDTPMYKNTYDFISKEYEAAKIKADATQNRLNLSYSEAHMRLIKFSGQTGTIFVGGDSELSCKCLKDAVDDAVLACKSAYEHGYIRGLNLETLSAINKLFDDTSENDTKDRLRKACLKMFFEVFEELAISVMYNKYVDDGMTREEFIDQPVWNNLWLGTEKLYRDGKDINTPKDIIGACIKNNYEYNIVTEQFAPAGYSVINSVSTDIEIIKATTSILSLLLSSNQLISINRQFDREKSIEEAEKRERKRYANIASGIIEEMQKGSFPLYIYNKLVN